MSQQDGKLSIHLSFVEKRITISKQLSISPAIVVARIIGRESSHGLAHATNWRGPRRTEREWQPQMGRSASVGVPIQRPLRPIAAKWLSCAYPTPAAGAVAPSSHALAWSIASCPHIWPGPCRGSSFLCIFLARCFVAVYWEKKRLIFKSKIFLKVVFEQICKMKKY
jgi:hypothetical protein